MALPDEEAVFRWCVGCLTGLRPPTVLVRAGLLVAVMVTYDLHEICTSGEVMNTKLTLRMDDALIQRAKLYSDRTGRSLSRLVSDFFEAIDAPAAHADVTPRVRSLVGALAGSPLDEDEYRRHLEEKHA
jgi:hypothetical protein